MGNSIDEFLNHAEKVDFSPTKVEAMLKYAGDGNIERIIDAADEAKLSPDKLQEIFDVDPGDKPKVFIDNLLGKFNDQEIGHVMSVLGKTNADGIKHIAELSQSHPGLIHEFMVADTDDVTVANILSSDNLTTDNIDALTKSGALTAMAEHKLSSDSVDSILKVTGGQDGITKLGDNFGTFLDQTKDMSQDSVTKLMELSQESPKLLETLNAINPKPSVDQLNSLMSNSTLTADNISDLMADGTIKSLLVSGIKPERMSSILEMLSTDADKVHNLIPKDGDLGKFLTETKGLSVDSFDKLVMLSQKTPGLLSTLTDVNGAALSPEKVFELTNLDSVTASTVNDYVKKGIFEATAKIQENYPTLDLKYILDKTSGIEDAKTSKALIISSMNGFTSGTDATDITKMNIILDNIDKLNKLPTPVTSDSIDSLATKLQDAAVNSKHIESLTIGNNAKVNLTQLVGSNPDQIAEATKTIKTALTGMGDVIGSDNLDKIDMTKFTKLVTSIANGNFDGSGLSVSDQKALQDAVGGNLFTDVFSSSDPQEKLSDAAKALAAKVSESGHIPSVLLTDAAVEANKKAFEGLTTSIQTAVEPIQNIDVTAPANIDSVDILHVDSTGGQVFASKLGDIDKVIDASKAKLELLKEQLKVATDTVTSDGTSQATTVTADIDTTTKAIAVAEAAKDKLLGDENLIKTFVEGAQFHDSEQAMETAKAAYEAGVTAGLTPEALLSQAETMKSQATLNISYVDKLLATPDLSPDAKVAAEALKSTAQKTLEEATAKIAEQTTPSA